MSISSCSISSFTGDLYITAVLAIAHDGWQTRNGNAKMGKVLCWRTPIGSRTYSDPDGSALVDFQVRRSEHNGPGPRAIRFPDPRTSPLAQTCKFRTCSETGAEAWQFRNRFSTLARYEQGHMPGKYRALLEGFFGTHCNLTVASN